MASALTETQLSKLAKLSHVKSLAARTKKVTDHLQSQINTLNDDVIKGVKVNGVALTPDGNEVDILATLEKQTVAEQGFASTYQMKVNGVFVGDKINIAKDWLLTGVTKDVVTAADKAAGGKFAEDNDFAEGNKYIDFAFNVKANGDGGTETTTNIYLNVNDLVDIYTGGNGIDVAANNEISIVIDGTSAGGLTVGANGLKLAEVTDNTYTEGVSNNDGKAGAMSVADKHKLDGVSSGANKTTVETEGDGTIKIDDATKVIVEIAADADVATMIDEELPDPTAQQGGGE